MSKIIKILISQRDFVSKIKERLMASIITLVPKRKRNLLINLAVLITLFFSTVVIVADESGIDGKLITSTSDYQLLGIPLDHIEDPVVYTPTPFVHCHLPLMFKNDKYVLSAKNFVNVQTVKQVGKDYYEWNVNLTIFILRNVSYVKRVPVYKDVPIFENKTITGFIQELVGYENVTDYIWKWEPYRGKDYEIKANEWYVIDIRADLPASIEGWRYDVVPSITLAGPGGVNSRQFSEYAWWNANWDYYTPFEIDSDYVANNLNNFPLMVNITSSDILSNSLPNGDDIRFVAPDNLTTYYYEKEYWGSGYAIFWVNVSEVSAISNTKVLVYYGNAGAGNGEDRKNTWHSNYRAVYHMNQTGAPVVDSTQYNQNSTATNGNPGYYRVGDIWKGVEYSHTADAHIIPQIMTNAEVEASGFTHICWFKVANLTADRVTMGLYNNLKSQLYVRLSGTYKYSIYVEDDPGGNNWADSTKTISTGVWYNGVGVFDKANTDLYLYLDGKKEGEELTTPSIETAAYTNTIGNTRTFGWGTNGIVDETRIYLGVLNATYINVSYRAENASSVLLIWGSEHGGAPANANPYVIAVYPANGTAVCPNAVFLSVTPVDHEDAYINVTFRSNFTGDWMNLNLTRYWLNNTILTIWITNFTTFNKTWWWNVSMSDGVNTVFTTPYFLSTAKSPANCSCEGGGGSTTITYIASFIGVIGLLGLLGLFLSIRGDKKR